MENLEWVTPYENTRHAIDILGVKHRTKKKPVLGVSVDDPSDVLRFESLAATVRYYVEQGLPCSNCMIWRAISGQRKTYRRRTWKYE